MEVNTLSIIVRRAVVGDAESIVPMHLQTHREAYGDLLPEGVFAERETNIPERVKRCRSIITTAREYWVAEDELGLLGFIIVDSTRDKGTLRLRETELQSIYVLKRGYGTGAGQALVDAALGSQPATVWLLEDNLRAMRFYRKLGFELNGNRKQLSPSWGRLWEVQMLR